MERSGCFGGQVLLVLLLVDSWSGAAVAQSGTLNDTGVITCFNASTADGTVSPATPDPEGTGFDEQDCTRGAAAADALGRMVKLGGSSTPGRDYTKIANDGSDLASSAPLGAGPDDWACTRDNVTGLIWELRTDDGGLRDRDWRYAWYDPDNTVNGGAVGSTGSDTCGGTLPSGLCNSAAYRDAVNALVGDDRLCGASDWRLPSAGELMSLVDHGGATAPYIDLTYFPETFNGSYWTGDTYPAATGSAFSVFFAFGNLGPTNKAGLYAVRLVRGVQ